MTGYEKADVLACIVGRYYEQVHGSSYVAVGFHPCWDVKFSDSFTLEIKLDYCSSISGNVAIEYMSAGKPSGILTSTAEVWLICVPENGLLRCYEVQKPALLRAVIEGGKCVSGGNEHTSLMKLLPISKLKAVSSREFLLRNDLLKLILEHP